MNIFWKSDNKKTCVDVTIKCVGSKKFRVIAQQYDKPNSVYADRLIDVNGERTIFLSFPITPKQMVVTIDNVNDSADTDFSVDLKETPLKEYNVWLDDETKDFVQMAIIFCQTCGFTNPPMEGLYFKSRDDKFKIKYVPFIVDQGVKLSTPARVGHRTRTIEVSKERFDEYTIPQRLVILLHEFSHVFRNPKIGLQISNEVGADLNALYPYLGLGFSKIDAIIVFCKVFLRAQTPSNLDRQRKIENYISAFEREEFAKRV